MMRFQRLQRAGAIACLGGSMVAIAACGSDTSTLTTAPPATATRAVTSANREPDTTSLIFQNDPTDVTVADVALILAASYLPGDRTEALLSEAAGNLLSPTQSLQPLDPIPTSLNINFAEVTGEPGGLITLEDAAVVQAALVNDPANRTAARLGEEAGRLLNVLGISVRAIPGAGLPPIPTEPLVVDNSQLINGSLTGDDPDNPLFTGSKSDDFTLDTNNRDGAIRVDLRSSDFDTRIQLLDRDTGELIGENDNSGPNTDSQLVFVPESDRNYIIRATSSDGSTGDYSLNASSIEAPPLSVPQADINGQLDNTDEIFETAFFVDYIRINAVAEERLFRLDLASTTLSFDPLLQVIDGSTGQIIANDDNGGPGNDARLEFIAAADVDYLIRVTSASPQQTGNYTLSTEAIEPPTAPDITNVSSTIANDTLSFVVTFAEVIDPPSSETGNPIAGILYFDIDSTSATGEQIAGDLLGADASINLNTQADLPVNFVELVDFESNRTQALVPIAFDSNSFRIDLELSDLSDIIGRPENGIVNYRFEILNLQAKGDIVPNQGVGTSPQSLTDDVGDIIDLAGMAAATRVRLQQVPSGEASAAVEPGME